MNIDVRSAELSLAKGKSVRMRKAAGSTLRVLDGSVWITEEDSPRDVVLSRGQVFRLSRRGLTIVEALGDASISLVPE